jgi:hypothetical protein
MYRWGLVGIGVSQAAGFGMHPKVYCRQDRMCWMWYMQPRAALSILETAAEVCSAWWGCPWCACMAGQVAVGGSTGTAMNVPGPAAFALCPRLPTRLCCGPSKVQGPSRHSSANTVGLHVPAQTLTHPACPTLCTTDAWSARKNVCGGCMYVAVHHRAPAACMPAGAGSRRTTYSWHA